MRASSKARFPSSLNSCGVVVRYKKYVLGRHRVGCEVDYTRSRKVPVTGCKVIVTCVRKVLGEDLDLFPRVRGLLWGWEVHY